MSETIKVYMSASVHKRVDLENRLSSHGKQVLFANPPQYAEEPDKFSPLVAPLKTIKFANHPDVRTQLTQMGIEGTYWAFAMDVNGMVPGKKTNGRDSVLLTTCRGEKPSIVKVSETAQAIYDRKKWGYGHVVFDNLCAPVKMRSGEVLGWTGYIDRAYLSISHSLLTLMSDMRVWRKVIDESGIIPSVQRPLDNAGATAGVDWSIFPEYLQSISKTTGVRDLKLIWKNNRKQEWVATENGVQKGMIADMTQHLRGFRDKTVQGIAML